VSDDALATVIVLVMIAVWLLLVIGRERHWRRQLRPPAEPLTCGAELSPNTCGKQGVLCERLPGHERYDLWHKVERPEHSATWMTKGTATYVLGLRT
jgi:hypothetical protein